MEQVESLKHHVMISGIRCSRDVVDSMEEPLSLHEYATTSGIALELPGRIYVNANYDEHYCAASDVWLEFEGTGYHLRWGSENTDVRIVPNPGYIGKKSIEGNRPLCWPWR